MAHRRLSDEFDSDLHSNGKPLVHLACDGSLCNVGQGLFHDSIAGEDVEIRLGKGISLSMTESFLLSSTMIRRPVALQSRVRRSMQAVWKRLPLWKNPSRGDV
jgi:hypothetical protein